MTMIAWSIGVIVYLTRASFFDVCIQTLRIDDSYHHQPAPQSRPRLMCTSTACNILSSTESQGACCFLAIPRAWASCQSWRTTNVTGDLLAGLPGPRKWCAWNIYNWYMTCWDGIKLWDISGYNWYNPIKWLSKNGDAPKNCLLIGKKG